LEDLCIRVLWLLKLAGESKNSTVLTCYLCTDNPWLNIARIFLKEAELRVTQMLHRNPTRFAQFRELAKHGANFPHSNQVMEELREDGWSWLPLLIKRDRHVCPVCHVEVSGFRPWHKARLLHNFGLHPPSFRPTST